MKCGLGFSGVLSGGITFDHVEVFQTVGEQHLGPVQRFEAGKLRPDSGEEREQHHRADHGHRDRRRIGVTEPVEQNDPRCRRSREQEQQRTGRIGEEVVDSLREIRLINRLNRVGRELPPRDETPHENGQRQQIERPGDSNRRQCRQTSESPGGELPDRRVQTPAPPRQQQ